MLPKSNGSLVKNLPTVQLTQVPLLGSGRSPGGGNDNPVQYPCLGNPTDRGAWWATVHRDTVLYNLVTSTTTAAESNEAVLTPVYLNITLFKDKVFKVLLKIK